MAPGINEGMASIKRNIGRGIRDLQNQQQVDDDRAYRRGIIDQKLTMKKEDRAYNRQRTDAADARIQTLQAREDAAYTEQQTSKDAYASVLLASREADGIDDPELYGAAKRKVYESPEFKRLTSARPDIADALIRNDAAGHVVRAKGWYMSKAAEAFGVGDVEMANEYSKKGGLDPKERQALQDAAMESQHENVAKAYMTAKSGDTDGALRIYNSTGRHKLEKITLDKNTGNVNYQYKRQVTQEQISQLLEMAQKNGDQEGFARAYALLQKGDTAGAIAAYNATGGDRVDDVSLDQNTKNLTFHQTREVTPEQGRYIKLLAGMKEPVQPRDQMAVERLKGANARAAALDKNIVGLQQAAAAAVNAMNATAPDDPQYDALRKQAATYNSLIQQYQQQRAALEPILNGTGGEQGIPADGAPPANGTMPGAGQRRGIPGGAAPAPSPLDNASISSITRTKAFQALPPAAKQQVVSGGQVTPEIAAELQAGTDRQNQAPPVFDALTLAQASAAAPAAGRPPPDVSIYSHGIPENVGSFKGEALGGSVVDAGILDPLARMAGGETSVAGKDVTARQFLFGKTAAEKENWAAGLINNAKNDKQFMDWYRSQDTKTLPRTAFGLLTAYANYARSRKNG